MSIACNIAVDDWVEIGYCYKISKEHVSKGAIMLLVPFVPCAYGILGRVKPKDKMGKCPVFCIGHAAVVT